MFKFAFVAVPVLALKHGVSQRMRKALAQSAVQDDNDCSVDESLNAMGPNQCMVDSECHGARTCSNWGWCQGHSNCDAPPAEEVCVNDLSSADSYGDNCDLYDSHPYWCGGYDTEDFNSLE